MSVAMLATWLLAELLVGLVARVLMTGGPGLLALVLVAFIGGTGAVLAQRKVWPIAAR